MKKREKSVLMPAPSSPISGKGPTPQMSSQLPRMFSRLPARSVHMPRAVSVVPSVNWRRALNTITKNMEMRMTT